MLGRRNLDQGGHGIERSAGSIQNPRTVHAEPLVVGIPQNGLLQNLQCLFGSVVSDHEPGLLLGREDGDPVVRVPGDQTVERLEGGALATGASDAVRHHFCVTPRVDG